MNGDDRLTLREGQGDDDLYPQLPTQIVPPQWGHTVDGDFVQADVVSP